jgi:hypothetical protein
MTAVIAIVMTMMTMTKSLNKSFSSSLALV